MSEGFRLTKVNLWQRHEERCTRVLRAALSDLAPCGPEESEDDINRRLHSRIHAAALAIEKQEDIELPVVVYEGRNPPLAADARRAPREHKRPDFYWAYHDHDGNEPARQFVAECKRLTAKQGSRDFSADYVANGVARFVSPAHGYGQAVPSGAMIGYLQKIAETEALEQVNKELEGAELPALADPPSAHASHNERSHSLTRLFPDSPFLLNHFWYTGPSSTPPAP